MPKRITPLSDIQVKNAKPQEKDYKLMDGFGLFLLVTPTNGKLWRFDYRYGDKRKVLAFGAYPSITLAEARQRREDAKKLLANGVDPGEMKKALKSTDKDIAANTFEVIARQWHLKFSSAGKWSPTHAADILHRLEKDIFPPLGSRPISEIKPMDLLKVLERIASRGALDTAHRLRHHCGMIFRYAVVTERAERDIAADLRGALPAVKNGHHAAPTTPQSLQPLLRAIDAYEGSYIVKCALQLLPLFFCRPGELRAAEWTEFDFDKAIWEIPATRMKMKQPHIVPLSKQAIAILESLQSLTGFGKYLFPCQRSTLRCMSDNAYNAALRRMGFTKDEATAHGFRASARTILDEVLHMPVVLIEHQLSHSVRDPLGRAYNRTSHLTERKKMMQQWADYLDGLKTGAKVIRISDRTAAK
ncbi:integrase arm-type DNA-binding domain-containing protein [Geobacter sp. DSM 9736]|uniref:tyrosine-type recombinase/integrase n=1 Tax=Geobacter sp. DSM 9736 TaxID=1277350 RepID=UPI000B50B715|nr:integrase arm-type DNA-binding domain-containing protein [Geobacter sp. DSM 9736]SNB47486.1 Integrase [Geobacter sp. DSM 9736]